MKESLGRFASEKSHGLAEKLSLDRCLTERRNKLSICSCAANERSMAFCIARLEGMLAHITTSTS